MSIWSPSFLTKTVHQEEWGLRRRYTGLTTSVVR